VIWNVDSATQAAAQNFPIPIHATSPLPQAPADKKFWPSNWQKDLRPGESFPTAAPSCTPAVIIGEFQVGHYLPALALTIHWGTMTRTKGDIYRKHPLQHIHNTLDQCAQSIRQTQDIQQAWNVLTNGLQWSNVITSKTLHFLCRALGFNQDPPVPIDGEVIIKRVWPRFKRLIPQNQKPKPKPWGGNDFSAYSRYMTAVLEWANSRQWTTTDLEATIYEENR
jgi:hypothetical protein